MSRADAILRSFGERVGLVPASPTAEPEDPLERHDVDLDFPSVAKVPSEPITSWRDRPKIHVDLREELERWEPQLRALGWSVDRIWRRSFWPHSTDHPRGLASILDVGDRILFADEAHVWLMRRDGTQQKLPRDG
jgi:hypothetical protein